MAEFYCDISAVGNEYQTYADAMVWGAGAADKPLPQDGTGRAGPVHSAAVAISEILIGALPNDADTLTIIGAVLTAKTTVAAKNQFAIGASISACTTNIVNLINTFGTGNNQCDAAVSSTACKLTLALPYFVRARVKPGTTDTVQIATRLAGADLNHATTSAMAITFVGWPTDPTVTQFATGADGPFAYLYNTAVVFGKADIQTSSSALGPPLYGLFFATASGPSDPAGSDVIHCRTRRSGLDLSHANHVITGSGTSVGTWKSRNYLFDNGTVWSGDNGKLIFNIKSSRSNSSYTFWSVPTSTLSFVSSGNGNFEIGAACTSGTPANLVILGANAGSSLLFQRCRFIELSDHGAGQPLTFSTNTASVTCAIDLSESFFQFRSTITSVKTIITSFGTSTISQLKFNGMRVEILAATGAIGQIYHQVATPLISLVEWIGGSIYDSNGTYLCQMPYVIQSSSETEIVIDNVAGVTDPSVAWSASPTSSRQGLRWVQSEGTYKAFRLQYPKFTVDWKSNGSFPYTTAADLSGTQWSHRVNWNAAPTNAAAITILRLSHFYRGAAASKTIKLSLYVPDTTTFYADELEFEVTYTDSAGVQRTEKAAHSRALAFSSSRVALSSDSASWTANAAVNHSAKKIELTTSQSIKSGSEIISRLSLSATRSPAVTFYVSPELVPS